jgi:protease I
MPTDMSLNASCELPTLVVIAHHDFNDDELQGTLHALQTAELRYRVASTQVGHATGMHGMIYNVTHEVANQQAEDYTAIAVIGGYGAKETLWEDLPLHRLLQQFQVQGKLVAAICVSPVVLGKAGLLEGKTATVWPDCAHDLEATGATYQNAPTVLYGHILTGQSPDAADAFGKALASALLNHQQPA